LKGRAHLAARFKRFNASGTYAYTHVYVRTDDGWRIVAAHTSQELPAPLLLLAGALARLVPRRR
jgi:hypothetical protein